MIVQFEEMDENRKQIEIIAAQLGVNPGEVNKQIREIMEYWSVAISEVIEAIKAVFLPAALAMKEMGYSLEELTEEINGFHKREPKCAHKKTLYKLDLARPIIQHQVTNRKPRNLNKKIIR